MLRVAFSEKYIYPLPAGHRFPIEKYELVKEQLVYEGTVQEKQLYDPGLCDEQLILSTHNKTYWESLKSQTLSKQALRRIGLPVTPKSVLRAQNSTAGTVKSAKIALQAGIGINLAGGTHHAYYDRGEGFCILNDIAIASNDLLNTKQVSKILVVDLDVHQGNGTATLFQHDDRVFTFSMHGANNYPLKKETSDLDIALPAGTEDELYLELLRQNLKLLVAKVKPEIVFYQAGVDVLEEDKLGKLSLTLEGCKMRDSIVLQTVFQLGIPVVTTMGGGYTERLPRLVEAHCNTIRKAVEIYA